MDLLAGEAAVAIEEKRGQRRALGLWRKPKGSGGSRVPEGCGEDDWRRKRTQSEKSGEGYVHRRERVELVLKVGGVLGVKEDTGNLSAIGALAGAFSSDLLHYVESEVGGRGEKMGEPESAECFISLSQAAVGV